jgi:hypothetical protein
MAETDHPLKRLLALAAMDFAVWLPIANGECSVRFPVFDRHEARLDREQRSLPF